MDFETSVEIEAAPEAVWKELLAVENWPQWTPTMRRVEPLDGGPLQIGNRVRIQQPRLPPVVWTVTELDPGTCFSWAAKGPGVTTVATHEVQPAGDRCRVRLAITTTGALAPVSDLLLGSLTRRYVQREAEGLKRRSEGS
jgi:uncharacterized membrane protein